MYVDARATLSRAGRALHDDTGPLLAAAGLKLQLLRMDQPSSSGAVTETLEILDQAMEGIRALSQELNASPAERTGLRNALARYAEQEPRVQLQYQATAVAPAPMAQALYAASMAAIDAALNAGAEVVRLSVAGSAGIRIRVVDHGKAVGRAKKLSVARLLAGEAGVKFAVETKKSTIVSITYGVRRSAGR